MKYVLSVFLFLFYVSCTAAQSPVVRAHLEPANNILVGQPVRLVVSVFVPNYFTGAPGFPEFEIENAIVVMPQDRPENSNTQINNVLYAGITQTYVIYPQQAGEFHVPAVKLMVPYAIAPPRSTTTEAAFPLLTFHAAIPASARDLPYFLPTTSLTIRQRWSKPLKGLRTGDSIERTITVTASRMQSMLIPPLALEQPDGLRIYSSEPVIRDQKTARGDFLYGQRIQNAKYLIQKAGDYTLPPIELQWWDLATKHIVTAKLPATQFSAVINASYKSDLTPPPEPIALPKPAKEGLWQRYRAGVYLALRVAGTVCVALLIFMACHRQWPRFMSWRQRYQTSERAIFAKLSKAARNNWPQETYVQLLRWLNLVLPGLPFERQIDSPAMLPLKHEIDLLTTSLYGRSSSASDNWSGKELVPLLKQARAHRSDVQRQMMHLLSPLNPSAE